MVNETNRHWESVAVCFPEDQVEDGTTGSEPVRVTFDTPEMSSALYDPNGFRIRVRFRGSLCRNGTSTLSFLVTDTGFDLVLQGRSRGPNDDAPIRPIRFQETLVFLRSQFSSYHVKLNIVSHGICSTDSP